MAEKIKVVMVDDEEELCMMVQANLEDTARYEVVYSSNPLAAVELIRKEKPTIVLLDLVMPKMKGTEIVKQLRTSADTKNIPIIIASGMGEMVYYKKKDSWKWLPNRDIVKERGNIVKEKNPERASEIYGVENFVGKPYATQTLDEVITETLEIFNAPKKEKSTDDMI